MPFIEHVAILGVGTGAGVAMKLMSDTAVAEVLLLQNPPVRLSDYFRDKARSSWGDYILPILPALIRAYEDKTGLSVSAYDYTKMIRRISVPQMMVSANFLDKKIVDETLTIYQASTYFKKRLYIDAESFRKPTSQENNKAYYDKLSAFVRSSLPSKSKNTRFRRLAMGNE